ncbi:MAG: hypothetical protein IPL79_07365 [Myxococcales bacterium]|nr:hypothetical protein [Myxococcales bacterium]
MIHLLLVAAIALLWARVLALHFGWPTWPVFGALAATGAVAAAQLGWTVPPRPVVAIASLGIALLAERQLAAEAARRPRLWWATLGGTAALTALAAPSLAPIALACLGWATWKTQHASVVYRWGASTFLLLGALGLVALGDTHWPGWPPLAGVPPMPTLAALEALLDVFGAFTMVLAVGGVAVAAMHAPGASALVGATLLLLTPLPWAAPWRVSWPWAFTAIITANLAIGWLATRPQRPSHRIALWLALTFAATAFAWVPRLL